MSYYKHVTFIITSFETPFCLIQVIAVCAKYIYLLIVSKRTFTVITNWYVAFCRHKNSCVCTKKS